MRWLLARWALSSLKICCIFSFRHNVTIASRGGVVSDVAEVETKGEVSVSPHFVADDLAAVGDLAEFSGHNRNFINGRGEASNIMQQLNEQWAELIKENSEFFPRTNMNVAFSNPYIWSKWHQVCSFNYWNATDKAVVQDWFDKVQNLAKRSMDTLTAIRILYVQFQSIKSILMPASGLLEYQQELNRGFSQAKITQDAWKLFKGADSAGPNTMLDIGCGPGGLLHALKTGDEDKQVSAWKDSDLYCVEVVDYTLDEFRSSFTTLLYGHSPPGKFDASGKSYQVEIATASGQRKYDLITINMVLHHIEKHQMLALLLNCRELLSDDGLLLIREHNPDNPADIEFYTFMEVYFYNIESFLPGVPIAESYMPHSYWSKFFTKLGFEQVDLPANIQNPTPKNPFNSQHMAWKKKPKQTHGVESESSDDSGAIDPIYQFDKTYSDLWPAIETYDEVAGSAVYYFWKS